MCNLEEEFISALEQTLPYSDKKDSSIIKKLPATYIFQHIECSLEMIINKNSGLMNMEVNTQTKVQNTDNMGFSMRMNSGFSNRRDEYVTWYQYNIRTNRLTVNDNDIRLPDGLNYVNDSQLIPCVMNYRSDDIFALVPAYSLFGGKINIKVDLQ